MNLNSVAEFNKACLNNQSFNLIKIAEALKAEGIRIRFLCHSAGFGNWGSFIEGDSEVLTNLVNF